jgi:alpha/beta superfamily hydrolase
VTAPVEKMVNIAGLVGALDGIFLEAAGSRRGGAVVAPPHPLYGGSMQNPVVSELAWACSRAGFASLRFDWRGVGASAGSPSGDAADADADYTAALAHLAETAAGPLVACGYSFGAAAALRAARTSPRVRRLVLVAPPPALIARADLAALELPLLVVTGAFDDIASAQALETLFAAHGDAPVHVIPEADHFFATGLAALGRVALAFLAAPASQEG